MIKVAIFASGTGSNALNINEYFKYHEAIQIQGIYCNNPQAGILTTGPENGIPTTLFNRSEFKEGKLLQALLENGIDYIVLAGFLWLIPADFVENFPGRIVNIHPALLPNYGGKGMYGHHVHEAVIANGEKESGITIHEVNEKYDDGAIIFQGKVEIETGETPDSLAKKIHQLEYQHFPRVIEQWILN